MQTEHGYDDAEKKLTRAQWDAATTEQRSGFLAEGYTLLDCPDCSGLGQTPISTCLRCGGTGTL
jgi:DnaJ-class molecular chaperone